MIYRRNSHALDAIENYKIAFKLNEKINSSYSIKNYSAFRVSFKIFLVRSHKNVNSKKGQL